MIPDSEPHWKNLQVAGCRTVYLDGSFADEQGRPERLRRLLGRGRCRSDVLDPVLLTFDPGRVTQKAKYLGELFPASFVADQDGLSFLEFFQADKDSGEPRGIIAIDLIGLT